MSKQKPPKVYKHPFFHKFVFLIGLIVLLLIGARISYGLIEKARNNHAVKNFQAGLESFYTPPNPLPDSAPGTLLRYEPITNLDVPGGTAYRILYTTEAPSGEPVVSSGMIFVPTSPAPEDGRKVLAWAHGTLGFGIDCTPSRLYQPALENLDMSYWLPSAMQRGWVVVATDYTGIGTPGNTYYLIGQSEAQDVINSVRAARNFETAQAGRVYATFGHSQGGHSSLSAAQYRHYAPELELVGSASAAPAAELGALFTQQYDTTAAWAIGPDVAASWPAVYPNLPLEDVLTPKAQKEYQKLAGGCIVDEAGTILAKHVLNESFFATNPLNNPAWAQATSEQTPNLTDIHVPLFVVQSTTDIVVLPDTTALLTQKACTLGKNITVDWLNEVTHQDTAKVGGLLAIDWLQDRFMGQLPGNTCSQPLPITPAQATTE